MDTNCILVPFLTTDFAESQDTTRTPRALSGHYFSFTNRNRSQRFDTKPRAKPRKYAVSEFSETAYFFVKTRRGHHRGHHFDFLGKSSFQLDSIKLVFTIFSRAGDFLFFVRSAWKCELHIFTYQSLIFNFAPL